MTWAASTYNSPFGRPLFGLHRRNPVLGRTAISWTLDITAKIVHPYALSLAPETDWEWMDTNFAGYLDMIRDTITL